MTKRLITAAVVLGFLSVVLGAMGAHKLKDMISADNMEIFEKGVRYQFYHVFAILATALLLERYSQRNFYYAGMFFFAGIICFSGSLYILALRDVVISGTTRVSDIFTINVIGPVTPIGGLLLLTGWAIMFAGTMKITKRL